MNNFKQNFIIFRVIFVNIFIMNENNITASEHIMEIRHAASGRFLNVRGYVADFIRSSQIFPHWNIDANVVNFRDTLDGVDKMGGFAGYKSAGFYMYNPKSNNLFEEKASKYWKTLIKNSYYHISEIQRFGCRTKTFIGSEKSFDYINERIYNLYFSENFKTLVGEKEKDLQIIVEVETNQFLMKIIIGPLCKNEASKHFGFSSDNFKHAGVYIDIDVSKTKGITDNNVSALLKSALKLTLERIDQIKTSIDL